MTDPGFHIYMITNMVNGKQYVGMTSNGVLRRWKEHKRAAVSGKKYLIHLAISKYGAEGFTVEHVASSRSKEQMGETEQAIIDQCGSLNPNGYNIAPGGTAGPGRNCGIHGVKGTRSLALSPDIIQFLKDIRGPGRQSNSEYLEQLVRESDGFLKFMGVPQSQKTLF